MKKQLINSLAIFSFAHLLVGYIESKQPKIIGLVPARNESRFLKQCLKSLALYTDAIVYLDDASEDNSVEIVESLAKECRVEGIIKKKVWHRDEPGDRNALLNMGRQLGGTHFIVLDADEMISANCLRNNMLKNAILNLKPGERLMLPWLDLWRGVNFYRNDDSVYNINHYHLFIFCDDGHCSYTSNFIHTTRVPSYGTIYKMPNFYVVLHFGYINWRNLLIKMAWYRCMEHIRLPNKSIQAINDGYKHCVDETGLRLSPVLPEWLAGYDFFDSAIEHAPEVWRERQVKEWFAEYGKEFFSELDIWNIDWN